MINFLMAHHSLRLQLMCFISGLTIRELKGRNMIRLLLGFLSSNKDDNYFLKVAGILVGVVLAISAGSVHSQILLTEVSEVETGYAHACALSVGGVVKCWGNDNHNQLGVGVDNGDAATHVIGLSPGVVELAVGSFHTCALTDVGGVRCWGNNANGQLGNGSTYAPYAAQLPNDVVSLTSGVVAISAGGDHTCALNSAGGVACWGSNYSGQLGDGTTVNRPAPVPVVGLSSGVVAISAGDQFSCALMDVGTVKCWGGNSFQQLGNGSSTNNVFPTEAVGLTNVVEISSGEFHSCALTTSQIVKCWGGNLTAQLGDGTTETRFAPVTASVIGQGVTQVSAGRNHTCVLKADGGARCWGGNNEKELGNGTGLFSSTPVNVSGLSSGVSSISAGYQFTCAVLNNGQVKCWGDSDAVYFSIGTPFELRDFPVLVMQSFSPTVRSLTRGNGEVQVRFSPPLNDTGHPVTGYTVVSRPAGGVDAHAGTTESYIDTGTGDIVRLMTGLSNGTTYAFTVTATNAMGAGLPSASINMRAIPSTDGTSSSAGSSNGSDEGCGAPVPVEFGVVRNANLTSDDCTTGIRMNDYYTDRYSFVGVPGQQIAVRLSSSDFDTHIYLMSPHASVLAADQDYTSGVSLIPAYGGTYWLPASSTGTHIIEVTSNQTFRTGAYSLLVTNGPLSSSSSISSSRSSSSVASSSAISSSAGSSSVASNSAVSSSAISSSAISSSVISSSSSSSIGVCNIVIPAVSGVASAGTLASGDCTTGYHGINNYTDRYSFTASPGQQVIISLSSSAFDSFVTLRGPSGNFIASDDDGGGGRNSRIPATSGTFTIPAGISGAYVVEVTSYSAMQTGTYSLLITSATGNTSSSFAASSVSSSVVSSASNSSAANACSSSITSVVNVANNGTLAATDCNAGARGAGYYTDRYTFTATSGQLVAIQLSASAFDTYLYLRNSSGTTIASNDDGGGGTNSRIPASSGLFTIPTAGTYVIEVTSYSSGRTGAYTLLRSQ